MTLLALFFYPEKLILGLSGHLLTVVLGDVFLFAPVALWVEAWVPWPTKSPPKINSTTVPRKWRARYISFFAAAVIGLAIGSLAYLGEISEDNARPAVSQILFVGSVFLLLGSAGVVIGYAFLGRLLGLSSGDGLI